MNISDYSVEGLEQLHNRVDEFFIKPPYCEICSRVIPTDVPNCGVSDCPHRIYTEDEQATLDEMQEMQGTKPSKC